MYDCSAEIARHKIKFIEGNSDNILKTVTVCILASS
jgi:hypothetical protein